MKKPLASQISKVDWQTEKLSSDAWRFLERIFAQFAELLPPSLTPVVQLRVIVEYKETEQISFKTFMEQFTDTTLFAILNVNETAKGLCGIDLSTSFSILDYLMGGKGDPPEKLREFTEIERMLFQKHVLAHFLSSYADAWKEVAPLNIRIEQMEFSSHNLVLYPYNEALIMAHFTLRLGIASGPFYLAFPFRHIREIVPKNPDEYFTQTSSRKTLEAQPLLAPIVGKKIESAALPITVELGKAEILFQELLQLEEGDIIRLDSMRGDPLRIKVSGKTKFLGKPGACDKKIAVQVTQILQEGDETHDE